MVVNKPNLVQTMCNFGQYGDQEFVVSCKSHPFAILTSPAFPTPAFTMVDWSLVRDLNIRMTELQCTKMMYGGQKLRILGRISTTVQCIINGHPSGNLQFKAHVIQDLYKIFDTHSIAGVKLTEQLIGPPFELTPENTTEPTEKKQPSPKKKRKKREKLGAKSSLSSESEEVRSPPSSPRPRCQGNWAVHQYYHGWHPRSGYDKSVLKARYENRRTGSFTFEKPSSIFSDDSFHSPGTVSSEGSSEPEADEYTDSYTNISTVRTNSTDASGPAQDCEEFDMSILKERREIFNQALAIPKHLQHVPIPHGAGFCNPDCPYQGEANLPRECGWHPSFGNIIQCSAKCTGNWWGNHRHLEGRDFNS
eukprot:GFUD01029717.1.p1 GENE.GFUD01029717.1~~GFUD01029717.1.p1  ORF type:complete len:363 (-),score=69.89 GFUD01029717.1:159-1247(-)